MKRNAAAAATAIFLVVMPGTMAGVIPWLLTGWEGRDPQWHPTIRIAGLAFVIAGSAVLLSAFVRFVVEGRGTPAPIAPTDRLVVGGLYRYVRNPMYLAVTAIIVGQGMLLGQAVLFLYAALFLMTTAAFVHWYEEPTLLARYGEAYEAYRRSVHRWRPRLHPWEPDRKA